MLQVSELEVFTTFRLSARLRVHETLNLGFMQSCGETSIHYLPFRIVKKKIIRKICRFREAHIGRM